VEQKEGTQSETHREIVENEHQHRSDKEAILKRSMTLLVEEHRVGNQVGGQNGGTKIFYP
jgi:hypothetical protein